MEKYTGWFLALSIFWDFILEPLQFRKVKGQILNTGLTLKFLTLPHFQSTSNHLKRVKRLQH